MKNFFLGMITSIRNNIQYKLYDQYEYISLLEKRYLVDVKLSKMFIHYIKSSSSDNNFKMHPKRVFSCNLQELVHDLEVYYGAYTKLHNIHFTLDYSHEEVLLSIKKIITLKRLTKAPT